MSKRSVDSNGYWEIRDNPLTKAGVFDYLGSEIGAPDPNRIYKVLRPAEEVEKAADSFRLMPFINDHEWLGLGGTPPEKKGVLGAIGEQIRYKHPHLLGNIKIHASIAQELIDDGKIELSPGYKSAYDYEPGIYEGQPYDYVQRNIRCNHLALVQEGRTGPDVSVQDARSIITIDTKEFLPMTIEELMAAIAKLSDEDKAKLLAGLAPVEDDKPKPKTEDENGNDVDANAAAGASDAAEAAASELVEAAELASEAAATGEPAAVAEAEAAVEVAEGHIAEVKEELDQATMDSVKRRLKLARTVLDSARKLKEAEAKTMDASSVVKMLGERDALANRLVPHVGTFDHSGMTIDQVAAYGCKQLGINAQPGTEVISLDAALQVRKADREKQTVDSKPVHPGDVAAKLWKEQ